MKDWDNRTQTGARTSGVEGKSPRMAVHHRAHRSDTVRDAKCGSGVHEGQLAGREQRLRVGILARQNDEAASPRSCKPPPCHRRPGSRPSGSGRWSGRSSKLALCANNVGANLRQGNELRATHPAVSGCPIYNDADVWLSLLARNSDPTKS